MKHSRLLGGLTVVLITFLSVLIGLSQLAFAWDGLVDEALGVVKDNQIVGGDTSVDTNYFPSAYGELTAENQAKLLADEDAFAVREQGEGSVLLKNDGALPLAANERRITLFGRAVADPVYRTSAAGPNPADSSRLVTMIGALETAGFKVNKKLFDAYAASPVKRETLSNGRAKIGEVPNGFYTDDLQKSYESDYNDVAIVMFARTAGEGIDLNTRDADGISQLALHKEEADLLKMIEGSGKFAKTVVLFNMAGAMETDFLSDPQYGIDAALWIGEPSMKGFAALPKLLTGEIVPSGRLVDTYAANSLSAPAVRNFGDVSFADNAAYKYIMQAEGIYVGYKYYETRYEDLVLNEERNADSAKGKYATAGSAWNYADEVSYPFGYGMSYTTFTQTLGEVTYDAEKDEYAVPVTVKNTGDTFAGRSVVQVYAQTPYKADDADKVEKSAVQLVGFGKTGVLAPDAEETVTVTVDKYLLASYAPYAREGKGGYVIDGGDHYLAIGDNAHDALNNILAAKGGSGMYDHFGEAASGDTNKVYAWQEAATNETKYSVTAAGEEVKNRFADADVNHWSDKKVGYMTRSDWNSYPDTVSLTLTAAMKKQMDGGVYKSSANAPKKGTYKTDGKYAGIDFIDIKDYAYGDDAKWNAFLDQLTVEEMAMITSSQSGGKEISKINMPALKHGDGPDGIGGKLIHNNEMPTCYASEIVAAATWNPETLRMRGEFLGEDALFSKSAFVWGPGANLHRTPFSGRNFEYYSEDSNFNYLCGSIQLAAMTKKGLMAAVKHFAGNDQETNRQKVATFNNEQAWREGAFRGFEGAIVNGKSLAVMTSFNLIGCTAAPGSSPLLRELLRGEWGFEGLVITDASFQQPYMDSLDCLMAGTNLFCLDSRESDFKRIVARSKTDEELQALRESNKQIYYAFARTNAINGLSHGARVSSSVSWWKPTIISIDCVFGVAACTMLFLFVFFTYIKKNKVEKTQGGNV